MNRSSALVLALIATLIGGGLGFWLYTQNEQAATSLNRNRHPLTVGTNIWPGYEPLYLARALGQYDEKEIRFAEYSNASQVIRAFQNGVLDAAALTLDEQINLLEKGFNVSTVLVMDISDGGDVILSKPEYGSLAALKGKKIGLEDGALGAFLLARAFEINRLNPEDYQLSSFRVNQHESAYDANQVQAVVTFEPIRSKLLAKGAKQIFSSREIPGEVVDVLVVHEKVLTEQKDRLQTLLKGWFFALNTIKTNPENAAQILSKRLQVPPGQVFSMYEGLRLPTYEENLKLLTGPTPPIEQTMNKLNEIMRANDLLKKPFSIANSYTADPLKQLQEQE